MNNCGYKFLISEVICTLVVLCETIRKLLRKMFVNVIIFISFRIIEK